MSELKQKMLLKKTWSQSKGSNFFGLGVIVSQCFWLFLSIIIAGPVLSLGIGALSTSLEYPELLSFYSQLFLLAVQSLFGALLVFWMIKGVLRYNEEIQKMSWWKKTWTGIVIPWKKLHRNDAYSILWLWLLAIAVQLPFLWLRDYLVLDLNDVYWFDITRQLIANLALVLSAFYIGLLYVLHIQAEQELIPSTESIETEKKSEKIASWFSKEGLEKRRALIVYGWNNRKSVLKFVGFVAVAMVLLNVLLWGYNKVLDLSTSVPALGVVVGITGLLSIVLMVWLYPRVLVFLGMLIKSFAPNSSTIKG